MIWVHRDEQPFMPGDLAVPGDTIRTVVSPDPAVTLLPRGAGHAATAILAGWPYTFSGRCWRPRCDAR